MVNMMAQKIMNNKKIFISGLAILCVFIIVLVVLLSKASLANIEDEDTLNITCPETAIAGEEVECSIVLNAMTIMAQGLSVSYSVSEGMEFVSFTEVDNWTDYAGGSADGFVLVDFNGVTGSHLVGTVKYTIPNTAVSNELYKVELVDATMGDGADISITFENVYDEIRILSDVNTLEGITLSSGLLDNAFDKEENVHHATVSSDKVTIGATKIDENSTIGGDIGEVTLHYGTNTYNIMVTSETGKENTYVLNIYRPYEFSSDTYTYSSVDNYIYTGTYTDNTSILANVVLPSELTSSIENDKLIISYGEEILLEIDIVNFTTNKYTVLNGIMYVESNLTYDSFMGTINLNGVSAIIYNNDTVVSSGTIVEGYKFRIYYDDTLLEEYVFKEEYLNINNLTVDDTNKIIKRVVLNSTYDSLISNISTTGSITVKDKGGNILNGDDKVKTSDVIEIKLNSGDYKYTVSVLGDITGDGVANMGDVGVLYRYLKGKGNLEFYQISAGDVINNGSIKVNDVSRIYRYHKGKVTSMEVEE